MAGHVLDMVTQHGQLGVCIVGLALGIGEHPCRGLDMPQQVMADQEHAMGLAEGDERIALAEVVDAGTRMHVLRLEFVLGGNAVELCDHQRLANARRGR